MLHLGVGKVLAMGRHRAMQCELTVFSFWLLKNVIRNAPKSYQEISDYLEQARESKTGRLWVDCFIKPTLIALMFMRSERQGNFLLQQYCLKKMLPYFAASGYFNYCRYISWYMREMQNLPAGAKADLLKGAHVCRHSDGGHLFLLNNLGNRRTSEWAWVLEEWRVFLQVLTK